MMPSRPGFPIAFNGMRRSWAVVAVAAILVSGCSYARPVENLRAACPLLAYPEAQLYLGEDVVAVEQQVGATTTVLMCNYQHGSEVVLSVNVQEVAARGRTPGAFLSSMRSRGRGPTTSIDGLGEAAIYYEVPQRRFAVLTAARREGSSIRLITLTAPQPISPNRLGALAAIALQHI
jgi:hypothetical protein